MLRCKQVSDALASGKYWALPRHKRIGLHVHVALCLICGPFNRFVMLMQDATRFYKKHEQEDPPPADFCLSEEKKRRMVEAMQKEQDASQ